MPQGDDLANGQGTSHPSEPDPWAEREGRKRPDTKELRIAASFSGGVSLAVWMGGLTSELDRLLRAGDALKGATVPNNPDTVDEFYGGLLSLLCLDVDVDVITGTSAGGINGAALAVARVRGGSLKPLQAIWREEGSFSKLLRDPDKQDPASLMQGDGVLLKGLEKGLTEIAESAQPGWGRRTGTTDVGFESRRNPLTLLVTSTMMNADTTTVRDALGTAVFLQDNQALFRFTQPAGPGPCGDEFDVSTLARAARSSASYPVGFEPSWVTAGSGLGKSGWLMDGGLRNNQPVGTALRAVWDQPAMRAARRVMLHIVPDPGQGETPIPADQAVVPNVLKAAGATVGAPFVQSWTADLQETRRRSRDSERRNAGLTILMNAFALSADEMVALLQRLRDQRRKWVVENFLEELDKQRSRRTGATLQGDDSTAFDGLKAACESVAAGHWNGNVGVPLTPEELAQFGPDLFNAAFLNALQRVREMEAAPRGADPRDGSNWGQAAAALHESRATGSATQWEREHLRTFLRSEMAGEANPSLSTMTTWFTSWLDRAFPKPDATALPGESDSIAGLRPSWSALLAWADEWTPFGRTTTESNPLVVRAAAWLLQAGAEYETPEVELVQMSAFSGTLLDTENRFATPKQKLTGASLSHFGAFTTRACRENDWMWGRLDGAGWLVHLLLEPRRLTAIADARQVEVESLIDTDLRSVATGDDPQLTAFWDSRRTAPELVAELEQLDAVQALPELSKLVASGIQSRIAWEGLKSVGEQMSTREDGGVMQLTGDESEQRRTLGELSLLSAESVSVQQIQQTLQTYAIPKTSFGAIMARTDLRDTAYRAIAVTAAALDTATPNIGPLKKVSSQVSRISRGTVNSLRSGFVAGKAALLVLAAAVLLLVVGGPALKAVALPLVLAALASLSVGSAVSRKDTYGGLSLRAWFWLVAGAVAVGVGLFFRRRVAEWLVVVLVALGVLFLAWLMLRVFRFLSGLRNH